MTTAPTTEAPQEGGASPPETQENSIEVRNLYKVFGHNTQRVFPLLKDGKSKEAILARTGCTIGVNNATFDVRTKEVFVIMGLSGSGKSTVIRCLNRLIDPTRGDVIISGTDIMDMNTHTLRELRRARMSMVFQHFGLLPHRNVQKNVEFGLEIVGGNAHARTKKATEAIALVGLEGYEDSRIDELSGGMQQRVGLARAIASDPEVLLMDEAFSALDPLIRTNMQDELLELQSRMHKTIVFITHDLDEALKLGDRIAIMKTTEKALDEYELELDLLASSGPAMAAALKRAIDQKDPIVVTGWAPHWKFARYDLKFLEDPKGVYGAEEEIKFIARTGFVEDMPAVAELLGNITFTGKQIGSLMDAVANAEGSDMDAVRQWMTDNAKVVASWK